MSFHLPSHDDFIRGILADRQVAIDYIKSALPESLTAKLDFDHFEQVPDTYLSEKLRKTMSDIVYRCRIKDSEENIYISLLIEHKSKPDKHTQVQIGGYLFSGFQQQIDKKEPLAPIVPILFYHGQTKWEYQRLEDLFRVDDELKKFVPSFDFIFHDLSGLDDQAIENLENNFLTASLLALKYSQNRKWLQENMVHLLVLTTRESEKLRQQFIIYLDSRSEIRENILNSLSQPLKSNVMSTLEKYYNRGVEKGREEGLEKGIEKGREEEKKQIVSKLIDTGRFTIEEIANFASVDESFVRKIMEDIR